MKKILLSIITTIVLSSSVMAQNVARECVLFEVFTGVNCPYCPAAAIAIGRMLDEGKVVAPVAYHTNAFSSPELYTNETNSRANYYSIYSYPTVKVDGMLSPEVAGGANNQEYIDYSYGQCVSKYNQRINVTSPFTIDLSFEYTSGTECKVVANVNKVGECNSSNVRLFIVLTESHIQRNWQGLTEVNFVTRDMIPNHNGVNLTSDSQTYEALIDMAKYPKENCEIVAWVQNYTGSKEVYQAVKLPLSSLTFQNDLVFKNIEETVTMSCAGKMSPRVTFENNGQETLTSVLFNIKNENGDVLSTAQWDGSLANSESAEFVIPEFEFDETSVIVVEAAEVNGATDGFPVDNIITVEIEEPILISDGYMNLQLKTGEDPENMSIELINMDDDEVIQTFVYDEPKHIYKEDIVLPKIGCYRMVMKNTAGNGFGGGFWGIKNSDGDNLIIGSSNENEFRYEFAFDITCDGVGVGETMNDVANIYPNPATSSVNIEYANLSRVDVYNNVGQLIFSQDADADLIKIDTENWTSGLYLFNIETKDGAKISQKIVVNN